LGGSFVLLACCGDCALGGDQEGLALVVAWARDRYRVDAVLQAGDFGFYRPLMRRHAHFAYAVPVHAVCGNHEDHRWLRKMVKRRETRRWVDERCLHYQDRGSVRVFAGSKVGFLGGALNVDRPQRGSRRRHTTNYILADQADAAVERFNAERPAAIVTHSCPAGIGIGIHANPAFAYDVPENIIFRGFTAGPKDDCGESQLARLWHGLTYRPRFWFFGHFHHHHQTEIDGTRFICLPKLGQELGVWDTDSGDFTLVMPD
jgi:hypothetical protein